MHILNDAFSKWKHNEGGYIIEAWHDKRRISGWKVDFDFIIWWLSCYDLIKDAFQYKMDFFFWNC
jgi:hypothetical protein